MNKERIGDQDVRVCRREYRSSHLELKGPEGHRDHKEGRNGKGERRAVRSTEREVGGEKVHATFVCGKRGIRE